MCREAVSGTRCLNTPMGTTGTHRGRSVVQAGQREVLILLILFFLFLCKHLELGGVACPRLSADAASPPEQPAQLTAHRRGAALGGREGPQRN